MAFKVEIAWKRVTPEGEKIQVCAHHFGRQWTFYTRSRRYDQWQVVENPPLEDWLELLDGVDRRAQRRMMPPEESDKVKKLIRERFPDASV